jgi:hypothetical protein
MSIELTSASRRLPAADDGDAIIYTAPSDCKSATVATGTVTNIIPGLAVPKLFLRIGGRDMWIAHGGQIYYDGSPWIMPAFTLMPGETVIAYTDIANSLDINITIGEQR